jgi:hypothetical protein
MNKPNMMAGDAISNPAAANRVSIRAVLAADGEDVTQALAQAGIVDPVAIPVHVDAVDGFLGDGITPNLTGVLEPDAAEDDGPGNDALESSAGRAQAGPDARSAQPGTAMLPPERGMQALAPVRKRGP